MPHNNALHSDALAFAPQVRGLDAFMPTCAYCKREGVMTREHVIPSFVYAFHKEHGSCIGWNEAAEKMLPGEGKVKDVCANCNNKILGSLDAYGKELLAGAGILVPNYTKLDLTLQYDFDKLVRWLLKMSFNSARIDGAHSHLFERLIPYMLGESAGPPRSKVAVIAYLAGPEYLDQVKRVQEPYASAAGGSDRLNPFLTRICYSAFPNIKNYTLRLNIFGPLVFYILLFHENVLAGHAASSVRHLLKLIPEAVELRPSRKLVELQAGQHSSAQPIPAPSCPHSTDQEREW